MAEDRYIPWWTQPESGHPQAVPHRPAYAPPVVVEPEPVAVVEPEPEPAPVVAEAEEPPHEAA